MGTGDMCRVPPAAVRHGRVRQSSGTGSCGDCKGVVGIVVPFAPRGLFGENSFYRAPGGKWAQETCVGCPQQRHAEEESGKVHGRDRVGIVEGSYVYLVRGVSIRGKFVLSRNPEYKTRVRHVAKRSSDPRVAYPEVKVVPFAPRVSIFGENSFYRAPGGKWAQETCVECPQQRRATEEPGKVQGRDRVGIVEGSCGYLIRGVSIRGKYLGPIGASCGYCCPLCPTGSQYSGKTRFIEPQGVTGHRRPVPGAPSSNTPRESQAKFKAGTVWDCGRVLWVPDTRSQYSGKIRFIEKPGVQDYSMVYPRVEGTLWRWVGRQTQWWPRHKAIYFSWFGPELFCLLLGPPGFNCWFSFAPVFQWCCSTRQGSAGVSRNTFLSSPHLCFITVFICDLFVSRDDPLMS